MDPKQNMRSEALIESSSSSGLSKNFMGGQQFANFDSEMPPKWDNDADPSFNTMFQFPELQLSSGRQSPETYNPNIEVSRPDQLDPAAILASNKKNLKGWDPSAMLSNLSFLEQKIHQLQDIVREIIGREDRLLGQSNEQVAHQQLVTADLTSIIIQLISTAGTLLPSSRNVLPATDQPSVQMGSFLGNSILGTNTEVQRNEIAVGGGSNSSDTGAEVKGMGMTNCGGGLNYAEPVDSCNFTVEDSEPLAMEDNDMRDYEDATEGENLPPGSYEVLQLEKEEILAPHTHFCSICGKGFKRDANLRMHMRGHGDEYKTPAALAKPASKESGLEPVLIKRYSCPFVGCKRNKDHKKFQPLKTILCVKNHYKRSHCDKSYTCSRCNSKKFSVIADLKTHEKHCGHDKWLCSCGTTFSRKDKLFGHVSLFHGHSPVLAVDEMKGPHSSELGQHDDSAAVTIESEGFDFGPSTSGSIHALNMKSDDNQGYFSQMTFDQSNFSGMHEFPRSDFEVPENSLSFLQSGSCNFAHKSGENRNSNVL